MDNKEIIHINGDVDYFQSGSQKILLSPTLMIQQQCLSSLYKQSASLHHWTEAPGSKLFFSEPLFL